MKCERLIALGRSDFMNRVANLRASDLGRKCIFASCLDGRRTQKGHEHRSAREHRFEKTKSRPVGRLS
jgi:hypothetical protein